jgi:hypothetical protein
VYAGHPLGLGFWPFFGANCGSRFFCSVRVKPTGNRDAGKFAADATQLPTGCQPESLAKQAGAFFDLHQSSRLLGAAFKAKRPHPV